MIRFIVESPLTDDQICASVFDPLDHISKLFLLVVSKLLVLVHAGYVQLVFGFGTGGLEWACENGEAGIFYGGRHLGVRHVFVDEYTFNESGVSQRTSHFS